MRKKTYFSRNSTRDWAHNHRPTTARQGRLTRIAGQLANGATVTEIAEREGIRRVRASTLANSPSAAS